MSHLIALLIQVTVRVPVHQGDVAAAHQTAIESALRELVVQAGVKSGRARLSDAVLAEARKYVDHYSVLDESQSETQLSITVEGEVATGRLSLAVTPPPTTNNKPPPTFELSFQAVDSPKCLSELRNALMRRLPGVTGVRLLRAVAQRFDLLVTAEIAPTAMVDSLVSLPFDGFHLARLPDSPLLVRVTRP